MAGWYPAELWAKQLTDVSFRTLEVLWQGGAFEEAARYRLAFREFGTTIGVQVNPAAPRAWHERVRQLHGLWSPHLYTRDSDITPVMYATSLLPGAFSRAYDRLPPVDARTRVAGGGAGSSGGGAE